MWQQFSRRVDKWGAPARDAWSGVRDAVTNCLVEGRQTVLGAIEISVAKVEAGGQWKDPAEAWLQDLQWWMDDAPRFRDSDAGLGDLGAACPGMAVLAVHLVEIVAGTDCRSLYDAANRLATTLTERRTEMDVASIREALATASLRWVPTDVMPVDALTKMTPKLRDAFRFF